PRAHPRDQPRHRRADRQERQPQRQRVARRQQVTGARQPGAQPRQVRIGPGQVPAFLPVERLVHEQRQPRGQRELQDAGRQPQAEEPALRHRRSRIRFVPHPWATPLHSLQLPQPRMPDDMSATPAPATMLTEALQLSSRDAQAQVNGLVLGKPQQVRLAFVALLADGHLLIEDLPGLGKTTLAHAMAATLGLGFQRVQFTSDLLPADILGVSVYEAQARRFEFHPGPVFTHVLLADEINRAPPRTQSALLEAMAEHQVTVDGQTRALPDPFLVIATQNPVDLSGTYQLPDSQRDSFLLRLAQGYPDEATERALLAGCDRRDLIARP